MTYIVIGIGIIVIVMLVIGWSALILSARIDDEEERYFGERRS